MYLAGRQIASHQAPLRGGGHNGNVRHVRPIKRRLQSGTRGLVAHSCIDARLAQDSFGTASSRQHEREAILLQRFKAHDAAVTATLVLQDAGALSRKPACYLYCQTCHGALFAVTGDTKEIVTASLDKSLALWRLQVLSASRPVCHLLDCQHAVMAFKVLFTTY